MTRVRIQDSLAYHAYRSARLLRRHFLALGAGEGIELTQEQWFVLNKLEAQDGQSQVDLSEDIFADRPNMTRILATMERRGLVRRAPDEEDNRRMRVFLTAKGRRIGDDFSAVARKARRRIFAGISEEELELAKDVLRRMEKNLLSE